MNRVTFLCQVLCKHQELKDTVRSTHNLCGCHKFYNTRFEQAHSTELTPNKQPLTCHGSWKGGTANNCLEVPLLRKKKNISEVIMVISYTYILVIIVERHPPPPYTAQRGVPPPARTQTSGNIVAGCVLVLNGFC